MSIARDALDNHGLIVGVSPERFRAVAMPLLFDHLNAQCEGTIAVNRQARIVWINDKYAEKVGIRDPASVLGKEIEEVLPASRLREVVESGLPSIIDLMAFGDEHFVVTRIPLRDEDGTLVGALGFVLFDRARHLKPLMSKYTSLQTQLVATQNELAKARRARYTIAGFIGNSPAASEIKRQARRAAQLDATVLLRGETGTGKELLAQGIHNLSPRARGPFVAVNVAAIPESLVEAELFGTAPGAFTGADRKARIGKFEVANGGTLFLDEIGDLPLPLQAKLLRVLQEQEVEPLGSNQVKALNVRVIAATHIDLEAKVAAGQFRDDLYYRLNVLALRVPPLRERASDIPAVVEHLLDDIANRSGQPPMELSPEALALLCAQPWRGNVRELGNLLERAQLSADGPQLQAAHLLPLLGEQARSADAPAYASSAPSAALPTEAAPSEELPLQPLAQTLAQAERRALQSALAACKGNRRRAAMELGISRASLYSKLQQHGLSQR
ncbi:sigma-54 interaction domain-containing protein [Stutzerimonas kunmingensis]|uniref:sigma-54 interaction domain-containing protein n=1 Tax=Stutzerimonas kunmingensis TaxID=1211807 RepID=UPI0005B4B033|nr:MULTISPECIES: sigma-54-dependent Fis family transcriptional regulator [Stutzerimonas stutzeri group]KJS80295.1 MAG: Fis family transcriptional regulator [[Pseudomonas] sp. BICA1-14]UIP33829.1 sigma-54-dependent Fis family transcriptional regulator [Stutzerimonas kunmingensis]HBW08189.1 sigma-54-dependent Fis family transcriptional regulator [Pseudomonas sp.]